MAKRILALNPLGTEKYDEVIRKLMDPVRHPDTKFEVAHLGRGLDYCDYWT